MYIYIVYKYIHIKASETTDSIIIATEAAMAMLIVIVL